MQIEKSLQDKCVSDKVRCRMMYAKCHHLCKRRVPDFCLEFHKINLEYIEDIKDSDYPWVICRQVAMSHADKEQNEEKGISLFRTL